MSIETDAPDGPPSALDQIGGPPTLTFPSGWTLSKSWQRVQRAPSDVSPGSHPAEWHVTMGGLEDEHEPLTDAEREAYDACVRGDYGVREFARATDRAPGTIGNLLGRARAKLRDRDLSHHRVTFAIQDGEVVADCPCQSWTYRHFCAHVAELWWRWSRGGLVVRDLDAGRDYQLPPPWVRVEDEEVGSDG